MKTIYNLVQNQIETENKLNEGLIIPQHINEVIDIIVFKFKDIELKIIDNKINIITKVLNFELFTEFLILINNLGYFVSNILLYKDINKKPKKYSLEEFKYYYYDEIKLTEEYINRLDFTIEEKLHIIKILDTNILYYVVKTKNLDEVLTNGILKNEYNGRVYCSYSYEHAMDYISFKMGGGLLQIRSKGILKYVQDHFIILKITLPLNNDLIFYEDPNYIGKGIYTYNNINKEYLQIIN